MARQLRYLFCDDWFIFARDEKGVMYYVNTELWPAWLGVSYQEQDAPDAVEKHMLPIARRCWEDLNWRKVEEPDDVSC